MGTKISISDIDRGNKSNGGTGYTADMSMERCCDRGDEYTGRSHTFGMLNTTEDIDIGLHGHIKGEKCD